MKTITKASGVYQLSQFGPQILTAFSGREFPNEKREDFLKSVGVSAYQLVLLRQVHGNQIHPVHFAEEVQGKDGDGLLTDVPGMTLGILTADCAPVFFHDPEHHAIGLAHAGWRGLKNRLLEKMIQAFRYRYSTLPSDLVVLLVPCIRKYAYEVGEEFKEYFPANYAPKEEDAQGRPKGYMDLAGEIGDQLSHLGVPRKQIFDTGICTYDDNALFYSARRERTDQRILSIIQIRPS